MHQQYKHSLKAMNNHKSVLSIKLKFFPPAYSKQSVFSQTLMISKRNPFSKFYNITFIVAANLQQFQKLSDYM